MSISVIDLCKETRNARLDVLEAIAGSKRRVSDEDFVKAVLNDFQPIGLEKDWVLALAANYRPKTHNTLQFKLEGAG